MPANATPTAAAEPGRRRYVVNILLFTAATVRYTFWFQRHLKVYVTEVLILGGTLSLLGVWKLAWDAFGTASGVKSDDRCFVPPGWMHRRPNIEETSHGIWSN